MFKRKDREKEKEMSVDMQVNCDSLIKVNINLNGGRCDYNVVDRISFLEAAVRNAFGDGLTHT